MPLNPPVSDTSVRKPFAVWVLQGFAAVFAVAAILGVVSVTRDMASGGVSDLRGAIVFLLLRIVLVGVLLLTVLASQRRKDYGRLLGLLFIVIAFLGCGSGILGIVAEIRHAAGGADKVAQLYGGLCGGVAALALIGYWFHAFGFTAVARAYFGVPTPR